MSSLDWLESYKFGAPEIDDGHKALLSVMRGIEEAVKAGEFARVVGLLDELIRVAEEHFKTEEAFLTRIGYQAGDAHAKYHQELLAREREVVRVCAASKGMDEIEGCCEELTSILVDGIVRGDLQFKSYLEEQGIRPHG